MFDEFGIDFGFNAAALDVGDFDAVAGFGAYDPTGAVMDGFGLEALGVDAAAIDGLDLDLGFGTVGYGSDLEDVVFAADAADLVDFDLGSPVGSDFSGVDVLDFSPDQLAGMDPAQALGSPSLPSPFLPEHLGGATVVGGGAAAAVPFVVPPIDTYSFAPDPGSGGKLATKLASRRIGGAVKALAADAARDEVKDQARKGAKTILRIARDLMKATAR